MKLVDSLLEPEAATCCNILNVLRKYAEATCLVHSWYQSIGKTNLRQEWHGADPKVPMHPIFISRVDYHLRKQGVPTEKWEAHHTIITWWCCVEVLACTWWRLVLALTIHPNHRVPCALSNL